MNEKLSKMEKILYGMTAAALISWAGIKYIAKEKEYAQIAYCTAASTFILSQITRHYTNKK
ncbi:hypothetical protein J4218_02545 [Candidatus Pacearchaeota archaeon]|nr:hypothetical protein [Candidatus Pacearchaeota archaeon]